MDPTVQATVSALNVIAIAVSIQTFLMVAGAIAAIVAWKRATVALDRRLAALDGRLDAAIRETRSAAQAVSRVSEQASGLLDGAHGAVRALAAMVVAPTRPDRRRRRIGRIESAVNLASRASSRGLEPIRDLLREGTRMHQKRSRDECWICHRRSDRGNGRCRSGAAVCAQGGVGAAREHRRIRRLAPGRHRPSLPAGRRPRRRRARRLAGARAARGGVDRDDARENWRTPRPSASAPSASAGKVERTATPRRRRC